MTEQIFHAIHHCTGATPQEVSSRSKEVRFVYARMVFTRVMCERGGSMTEIAEAINRNYSQVYRYYYRHRSEYLYNARYRRMYDAVQSFLKSYPPELHALGYTYLDE